MVRALLIADEERTAEIRRIVSEQFLDSLVLVPCACPQRATARVAPAPKY